MERIGLVVHPRRAIERALDAVADWAAARRDRGRAGADPGAGAARSRRARRSRRVRPDRRARRRRDDARRRCASPRAVDRPVLGVACGSLGALTAVTRRARRRGARPRRRRRLDRAPAARAGGRARGASPLAGVNDLVIVRDGAGQVIVRGPGRRRAVRPLRAATALVARDAARLERVHARRRRADPRARGRGPGRAPRSRRTAAAARRWSRTPAQRARDPGSTPATAARGSRSTVRSSPAWSRWTPVTYTARLRDGHATLVALGGEESLLAGLRRRRDPDGQPARAGARRAGCRVGRLSG